MASRVAWLDHDDKQRSAMLEIVDLFREKGTVDDLGYGVVRDVFADVMFPGVSVLHTRPKYLLFTGWIYSGLLTEGVAGQRALERGRGQELRMIQSLLDAGETDGVIGRIAGRRLKRVPSVVYWAALRRYGILRVSQSLESYCRAIPGLRQSGTVFEEGQRGSGGVWHLLPAPEAFPQRVETLSLSLAEADFLYERVMSTVGDSYLGWLLNQPPDPDATHPWTHSGLGDVPRRIAEVLTMAEHYSLSQHGPSLLYNLLVARVAKRDELADGYLEQLVQWAEEMNSRYPSMPYPLEDVWRLAGSVGARITPGTSEFVRWTLTMTSEERSALAGDSAAAARIEAREFALKKSLSRLRGSRSLDGWSGSSGTGLMGYRWQSALPMVNDIVTAREASHA